MATLAACPSMELHSVHVSELAFPDVATVPTAKQMFEAFITQHNVPAGAWVAVCGDHVLSFASFFHARDHGVRVMKERFNQNFAQTRWYCMQHVPADMRARGDDARAQLQSFGDDASPSMETGSLQRPQAAGSSSVYSSHASTVVNHGLTVPTQQQRATFSSALTAWRVPVQRVPDALRVPNDEALTRPLPAHARPVGLSNPSCFCYSNAVLQCLFWMDPQCTIPRHAFPTLESNKAALRAYLQRQRDDRQQAAASSVLASDSSRMFLASGNWIVFVDNSLVAYLLRVDSEQLSNPAISALVAAAPLTLQERIRVLSLAGPLFLALKSNKKVVAAAAHPHACLDQITYGETNLLLTAQCFYAEEIQQTKSELVSSDRQSSPAMGEQAQAATTTDASGSQHPVAAMTHVEHPWTAAFRTYSQLVHDTAKACSSQDNNKRQQAGIYLDDGGLSINPRVLKNCLFGGKDQHEDAAEAMNGLMQYIPENTLVPVTVVKLLQATKKTFPAEDVSKRSFVEMKEGMPTRTEVQSDWALRLAVPEASPMDVPVSLTSLVGQLRYHHYRADEAFLAKYADPIHGVVREYRCMGEKLEWRSEKPPICLFVHFKRFVQDYTRNTQHKVETRIEVPLLFDFAKYLWRPLARSAAAQQRCGAHMRTSDGVPYILTCFIVHEGSMAGGHYTTYVQAHHGIWYHCDDTRVTRVDERSDTFCSARRNSYIAVYIQKPVFDVMHPIPQSPPTSSPSSQPATSMTDTPATSAGAAAPVSVDGAL
jgi:hypothetical protein